MSQSNTPIVASSPAQQVEQQLDQLRIVDLARDLAFPLVAVGAAVSALSGVGIAFPALAIVGGLVTWFGGRYARKKKTELSPEIDSLASSLDPETIARMRRMLNGFTSEGPPAR